MKQRVSRTWVHRFVLVLLLVLVWQFVLPPTLGGKTSFITTSGKSMEPLLHSGDLAVIRKQSTYKVGDVIEFRAQSLGMPLLHRIVSIDAQGITTQGDNNNFTDLDHPTNKDIIGKLVYHRDGGGKFLDFLQSMPVRIAGALLLGLVAYNLFKTKESPTSHRPGRGGMRGAVSKLSQLREEANATGSKLGPDSARFAIHRLDNRTLVKVFATVIAASLVVCALAFSRPVMTTEDAETIYNFEGKFNYSASAPGSDLVYADGQLQTGDPIYLNLVKSVFVTYTARLKSPSTFKGSGEITMKATLQGASGWNHELPITSTTSFKGDEGRVTAEIDLMRMIELTKAASDLTKVKNKGFSVVLQPTTQIDGTLGGAPLATSFSSKLTFSGNEIQVKAKEGSAKDPSVSAGTKTTEGAGPGAPNANDGGTLKIPKGVPAKMQAFGVGLGVAAARGIGVIGVTIGLAGLLLAFIRAQWGPPADSKQQPRPRESKRKRTAAPEDDLLHEARAQFEQLALQVNEVHSLDELKLLAADIGSKFTVDAGQSEFRVTNGNEVYVYRHTMPSAEVRFGINEDALTEQDRADS
jgi:signal peptidase I